MKEHLKRDVTVLSLRDACKHPKPQEIILKLDSFKMPRDIGCVAYKSRDRSSDRDTKYRRDISNELFDIKVDPESLCPSRIVLVQKVIDDLYIRGLRDSTIRSEIQMLKKILDWCDDNNHSDVFTSTQNATAAYKSFTDYIDNQLRLGLCQSSSATAKQRYFRQLLAVIFVSTEVKVIIRHAKIIKEVRAFEKDSVDKSEIEFWVDVHQRLARGYAECVLKERSLPFAIDMGEYNAIYWNCRVINTNYNKSSHAAYDHEKLRLRTYPECVEYLLQHDYQEEKAKSIARGLLYSASRALRENNKNMRSISRLTAAKLAVESYFNLFLLILGIHRAELAQVELEEQVKHDNDIYNKDFRAVKFRAMGREVVYNLGSHYGLNVLKDYLELRRWILNGKQCKYLFFSFRNSSFEQKHGIFPELLNARNITSINKMKLTNSYVPVGMTFPSVNSIRNFKNLVFARLKYNASLRAKILNHSVETNIKDYSSGDYNVQKEELGKYWYVVKNTIVRFSETTLDDSIGAGHCEKIGQPEPISNEIPITPDCKSQYGCLFCEHYICHADEEDVHKLLSLLYVIDVSRQISTDLAKSDALLDPLVIRINFILEQIKLISSEVKNMVSAIEKKVMEIGVLTPFWELKLRRLEKLGVI